MRYMDEKATDLSHYPRYKIVIMIFKSYPAKSCTDIAFTEKVVGRSLLSWLKSDQILIVVTRVTGCGIKYLIF